VGYSLVFAPSVFGVIGDCRLFGLNSLSISTVNTALAAQIPELLFFAFQCSCGDYACG